ncbi:MULTISPECIES: acyl carrier protein [Streptomyces]|uniref:acyl carrier protein n=1 Tax=Streptomyces TaxID=1883 RepID=UPI00163CD717|nr:MULTISPECIES: acyl carrier protein [Streptomyces]MBC2879821.1 acyl carrier protein [Streptomyces sp. TYQ1024]UBI36111.1 acyl carrier protein [Streptomyces mobaraensis]UKW28706.1 acyl carrier protein [Streptomyces sp. TYQ1024]
MQPAASETTAVSAESLTAWLIERIAEHVRMPAADISPDRPMTGYGLSSLYALTLASEIEDHLDITVDDTIMWDNPTVASLVDALLKEIATSS